MINVNQMMNSTAILYAKIDANPVGTIELVDRCLHRCSSPVAKLIKHSAIVIYDCRVILTRNLLYYNHKNVYKIGHCGI